MGCSMPEGFLEASSNYILINSMSLIGLRNSELSRKRIRALPHVFAALGHNPGAPIGTGSS